MEKLPPLIKAMKQPGFYPHPVSEPIKLLQTHISYVFLTGDYAYKIKKPVDFGFLDFSTTEKRQLYCNEEVRLNSRAAPGYYLQVLAIAKDGSDHYFFSNEKSQDQAQIVEYCVHMKQFPSGQLFSERLKSGQLDNGHMIALGRKVAQFHAKCTTNETVLSFGNISIIRKAIDENYAQTEKYVAAGIQTRQQIDETKKYTDNYFATKEHLFKKRMDKKKIIEGHGDLHLRNITLDGDEIVLFDCIEFSEEFRFIDTMYDIGFVIVGLESKGKFEMANEFLNEYLERTADWEGVEILRIYLSRQAYVKAKVKSFMYDDPNVADDIKQENIRDARVYYTLSWNYTQVTPGKIFIMCGLSGSGKSTIGKKIAFKYWAVHIRSDAVRKHICNVPLEERGGNEIYTKEVSQKTYDYMIDVACRLVPEGWNVILDATYAKVEYRQSVIEKCQAANIEMKIIYCTAPVDELRRRVRDRKGDITDANEKVLEMQLKCFEAPNKAEERYTVTIDTTQDVEPQLNHVQS